MLREMLGLVENLVRNGDGGLHTKSTTGEASSIQPESRGAFSLAALASPAFSCGRQGEPQASDKPVCGNTLLSGLRSKSLEREVRSNDLGDILWLKLSGVQTQPVFVSVVLAIGSKPVGALMLKESAP